MVIDRIDLDQNTFTIVDYKTGKTVPSFQKIARGTSLQLPLYIRVAEDLLQRHYPELHGVAALYHKLMDQSEHRKPGLAVKQYMETAFERLRGRDGILKTPEELDALIEGALAGVHLDAYDVAGVAQKGVL